MSHVIGFCHRVAYAAFISQAVLLAAIAPLPYQGYEPSKVVLAAVRILDAPIAFAGLLLPCQYRGMDLVTPQPLRCRSLPMPDFVAYHLVIGIPAYVLLFYIPTLFSAIHKWRRIRRGSATSRASTGNSGAPQGVTRQKW